MSAQSEALGTRRRAVLLSVGAIVVMVGGIVAVIISSRAGTDHAQAKIAEPSAVRLSGKWHVTDIHTGGTTLHGDDSTTFSFDEGAHALDVSVEDSSFSCTFTRDKNVLALSNCIATPDMPEAPTERWLALNEAYDRAFRSTTASVRTSGDKRVTVTLSGVEFELAS